MIFHVSGIPAPGGSKNAFAIKKGGKYTGKVALVDAGGDRNVTWRARVRLAATLAQITPIDGPVMLSVEFLMPRPKSHYKKGVIRPDAPKWHTNAPDATKLVRSTEDALVGLAWHNDSQVCVQTAVKFYSEYPGAKITIVPITPE